MQPVDMAPGDLDMRVISMHTEVPPGIRRVFPMARVIAATNLRAASLKVLHAQGVITEDVLESITRGRRYHRELSSCGGVGLWHSVRAALANGRFIGVESQRAVAKYATPFRRRHSNLASSAWNDGVSRAFAVRTHCAGVAPSARPDSFFRLSVLTLASSSTSSKARLISTSKNTSTSTAACCWYAAIALAHLALRQSKVPACVAAAPAAPTPTAIANGARVGTSAASAIFATGDIPKKVSLNGSVEGWVTDAICPKASYARAYIGRSPASSICTGVWVARNPSKKRRVLDQGKARP